MENDYSSTQNNFDIVSSRTNVSDDQPSVSNYLEAVSQATLSSITNLDSQDLYTILATVGLEKYSRMYLMFVFLLLILT